MYSYGIPGIHNVFDEESCNANNSGFSMVKTGSTETLLGSCSSMVVGDNELIFIPCYADEHELLHAWFQNAHPTSDQSRSIIKFQTSPRKHSHSEINIHNSETFKTFGQNVQRKALFSSMDNISSMEPILEEIKTTQRLRRNLYDNNSKRGFLFSSDTDEELFEEWEPKR